MGCTHQSGGGPSRSRFWGSGRGIEALGTEGGHTHSSSGSPPPGWEEISPFLYLSDSFSGEEGQPGSLLPEEGQDAVF